MLEAACEEDDGLDFAAFSALVRAPSDDLDAFDARLPRPPAARGMHARFSLEAVPEADG